MAARNRGVLPLQRDFDPNALRKIKHTITKTIGNEPTKTSIEISVLSIGASRMELISFITEFNRAAKIMKWIDAAALFLKFQMHLQVQDLDVWNTIIGQTQMNLIDFTASQDSFKRSRFMGDSYEQQVKFLKSIKKPKDIEPSLFNALLSYHNLLLRELPGVPAVAADASLSAPKIRQEKFEDASKTTSNTSLQELQDYMQTQSDRDSAKSLAPDKFPKKGNRNNGSYGNNNHNHEGRNQGDRN